MVGLFCDVEIRGRTVTGVRSLPRSAVHAEDRAGDVVWVATPAGELHVRPVQRIRSDRQRALVELDLAPGERVITSQLKGVTHGMTVRVAEQSPALVAGGDR